MYLSLVLSQHRFHEWLNSILKNINILSDYIDWVLLQFYYYWFKTLPGPYSECENGIHARPAWRWEVFLDLLQRLDGHCLAQPRGMGPLASCREQISTNLRRETKIKMPSAWNFARIQSLTLLGMKIAKSWLKCYLVLAAKTSSCLPENSLCRKCPKRY